MSFLGTVLGGVTGFLTGGPAGAIIGAGTAAGLFGGGTGTRAPIPGTRPMLPMPFSPIGPGMGLTFPIGGGGGGVMCPPGTSCSGASTDGMCIGSCLPMVRMGPGGMMCAPRGFHLNKRKYAACGRGGAAPYCVPALSKLVRNRKLNPANGHAARRAVRRITATHRLLKRIEKSIRRIKGVRGARVPRGFRGGGRGPTQIEVG